MFHFEFEFIHPFIDGNGRTGRLWQSLILGKLHPLFEHLPVENMVYSNQQQYYDAITASTNAGESGPFIDFMLNEIYKTLKSHQGEELPLSETNPIDREFGIKFGEEFGIKFGIKFGINKKPHHKRHGVSLHKLNYAVNANRFRTYLVNKHIGRMHVFKCDAI